MEIDFLNFENEIKNKSKTVVRLSTTCYHNDNSLHIRKDLIILRKKSSNSLLIEDANHIGADLVIESIINFNECEDGIYEVVFTNISYDGDYMDDWKYKLVKYEEVDDER